VHHSISHHISIAATALGFVESVVNAPQLLLGVLVIVGGSDYRPEQTLLYQLVERYYPEFAQLMALQGFPLPVYFAREFEDYLKCGRV
jgi:hypothetical protein